MPENDTLSVDELKANARHMGKGNVYEDFELNQVYQHHWGRTLTQAENALFSTLTLHFNPLYFNKPYAQSLGHQTEVLNPLLIFNTVFGLSVEDLSEAGMGPFLGVEELTYHEPVYPGDTLTARSIVVSKRESAKRPNFGIVGWHTEGFRGDGKRVIDFKRSNLIIKRQ